MGSARLIEHLVVDPGLIRRKVFRSTSRVPQPIPVRPQRPLLPVQRGFHHRADPEPLLGLLRRLGVEHPVRVPETKRRQRTQHSDCHGTPGRASEHIPALPPRGAT